MFRELFVFIIVAVAVVAGVLTYMGRSDVLENLQAKASTYIEPIKSLSQNPLFAPVIGAIGTLTAFSLTNWLKNRQMQQQQEMAAQKTYDVQSQAYSQMTDMRTELQKLERQKTDAETQLAKLTDSGVEGLMKDRDEAQGLVSFYREEMKKLEARNSQLEALLKEYVPTEKTVYR